MKKWNNEDKSIQIYNGDCINIMNKLIEDGVNVDMILTDPPYGTTACKWDTVINFDIMWGVIDSVIKQNGATCLFGIEPFSSALRMSNIKEYRHEWYWNKVNAGNFVQAKNHPLKLIENIIVFSKQKVCYSPQMNKNTEEWTKKLKEKNKNKKQSSMEQTVEDKYFTMASGKWKSSTDESLSFPKNLITISKFSNECNSRNRVHPTQKPVELLEYLIKTYTNEGDLVLDFTMGSGSTGVACKNLNRRFIGIELDEKYYGVSKKRLDK